MVPQHKPDVLFKPIELLNEFYNEEKKVLDFIEDEILSCLITHKGEVVHEKIKEALGV